MEYYERTLGVPCPYSKYDIGFVPRLDGQAMSVPGLMLVNESLLARMADPDDDFVAMVCAHEVSHLWFGCHVSMRWWDDLWLDEASPACAAVIRQLAALIGEDALRAGLADYMRRFGGGSAGLDDLIGCWSRSSGQRPGRLGG